MTVFWLLTFILMILALFFILSPAWPYRNKNKNGIKTLVLLSVCFPIMIFGLYQYWGNYNAIKVNAMLQGHISHTPKVLVTTLNNALIKQPGNYRAWYLLGESWMAAKDFDRAAHAFKKAANMTNNAPDPLSKYAQMLFMKNDHVMTHSIEQLTDTVLIQDENNKIALGLKGIATFKNKNFDDAIRYWTRLLAMTEKPETRKIIQSGIHKAKILQKQVKK